MIEVASMNYVFTGILIILLCLMTIFMKPNYVPLEKDVNSKYEK